MTHRNRADLQRWAWSWGQPQRAKLGWWQGPSTAKTTQNDEPGTACRAAGNRATTQVPIPSRAEDKRQEPRQATCSIEQKSKAGTKKSPSSLPSTPTPGLNRASGPMGRGFFGKLRWGSSGPLTLIWAFRASPTVNLNLLSLCLFCFCYSIDLCCPLPQSSLLIPKELFFL